MDISGINLVKKQATGGRNKDSLPDVRVSYQPTNKRICIAVNNDLINLIIDKDLQYIMPGTYKNRLYFIPTSDISKGYKPTKGKVGESTQRIQFTGSDKEWGFFIGRFELKYDKNRELFYVEVCEEKE